MSPILYEHTTHLPSRLMFLSLLSAQGARVWIYYVIRHRILLSHRGAVLHAGSARHDGRGQAHSQSAGYINHSGHAPTVSLGFILTSITSSPKNQLAYPYLFTHQ